MYCRTCGKEILDAAVICVNCGVPTGRGGNHCQICGADTNPAADFCIKCGSRLGKGEFKSKIAAGLFGIFLGGLGVHRFYLGYIGTGIIQILVTLFTCGFGAIWGLIEGILILTDQFKYDAEGRPLVD
ncbi:MAG: hypothetical protein A2Y62_16290 [Candidatus Fischerbacteria bacterium RBG_13_37_8]|uniref:Uncharacterized protein n=1 Tax=Candidatus Fischerbacteria bacterium RBG_13_37_8 TaxID=1817863 RepID=A0A1F5VVN3_9BACT|nr:MAG: hypothetical protein A2Y62_16290 [Candidatus Fischerbacteria bacterium RBG_13_37_8]